jgi:hypothetical protein
MGRRNRKGTTRPDPRGIKAEWIRTFRTIGPSRGPHEIFADFLELAYTAVSKRTHLDEETREAIEKRYMDCVRRYTRAEAEAMSQLLALTVLGVRKGGGDFLGSVASDLELLHESLGQYFTPYQVSLMMAEMSIGRKELKETIREQGFITFMDPCCGAGGMMLAAAEVVENRMFDPRKVMYVEAKDISPIAFKMAYLQLTAREIPACVRLGNSLAMTQVEAAHTPAFFPFAARHAEGFLAWLERRKVKEGYDLRLRIGDALSPRLQDKVRSALAR